MNAQAQETNRNPSGQKLAISGKGWSSEGATVNLAVAMGALVLSWVLFSWFFRGLNEQVRIPPAPESDLFALWGILGLLVLLIGLIRPAGSHQYLDFRERKIIKERWYSYLKLGREEIPLSHFRKIVVHHVCHPGGEGEDTFTGSVGLKPLDAGAIFWVKEFSATKDEMPAAPDQFARELALLTGLPYRSSTETAAEGTAAGQARGTQA